MSTEVGQGKISKSIDNEIQAVQDLEKVNTTVFEMLASSKYSWAGF